LVGAITRCSTLTRGKKRRALVSATLERKMTPDPGIETHGQSVLRRFESYGFWLGLGLGLLVGILICGPNFHDWEPRTSFWVIFSCAVGGAIIGFISGPFATASSTRCPGIGSGADTSIGDIEMHSGDGGSGDDGEGH
jgi:hypothetical protein